MWKVLLLCFMVLVFVNNWLKISLRELSVIGPLGFILAPLCALAILGSLVFSVPYTPENPPSETAPGRDCDSQPRTQGLFLGGEDILWKNASQVMLNALFGIYCFNLKIDLKNPQTCIWCLQSTRCCEGNRTQRLKGQRKKPK